MHFTETQVYKFLILKKAYAIILQGMTVLDAYTRDLSVIIKI